jgi:hypothetical protein
MNLEWPCDNIKKLEKKKPLHARVLKIFLLSYFEYHQISLNTLVDHTVCSSTKQRDQYCKNIDRSTQSPAKLEFEQLGQVCNWIKSCWSLTKYEGFSEMPNIISLVIPIVQFIFF